MNKSHLKNDKVRQHEDRHKGTPQENGGRDGSDAAMSQWRHQSPEAGKGREGSFPRGFMAAQMVKKLPAVQETGFDPWIRKTLCRREWLPTPVFLPEEFHGQRSLVGYSRWDHRKLDMTEQLSLSQGSWPCCHLDFRLLASRTPREYLCFKSLHWWRLVTAALGNLHTSFKQVKLSFS